MTPRTPFIEAPVVPEAVLRIKAGSVETVFSYMKQPNGFHSLEYVTDYPALIAKRKLLE